jgi:NitT/TauT family transport system substrate-binding protein
MNGKKVGLWGRELSLEPTALFRNYGIQVKSIPQATTVNLFLRGGVEVVSAMWYNEYHIILSAGVDPGELTVFRFADYGMNFPEDGIYCLESTYREDPQVCRRFVLASIEGWRWAFDHREEALDIVMRYVNEANIATNRDHQKWMLDRMHDLIDPDDTMRAAMVVPEELYENIGAELAVSGLIDAIPPYSEFFATGAPPDEK